MNNAALNKNLKMLERLEELIGADNYKKVIAQFAGKVLYFPKKNRIAERHEQIRQEYAGGAEFCELAVKHRYTERHVREIVRGQVKQEPARERFFSRIGKAIAKIIKRSVILPIMAYKTTKGARTWAGKKHEQKP
jgi:predicted transcriptional regulator